MPLLRIVTNVERKAIPDNFLEEATDVLAQTIGKAREVRYTPLIVYVGKVLHLMDRGIHTIKCTSLLRQ